MTTTIATIPTASYESCIADVRAAYRQAYETAIA